MAKGYLIAHIDIHDSEKFGTFREMSAKVVAEFGGKVLVGNPAGDQREGSLKPVTIVVEFPDLATAQRFYDSQGYTEARKVRQTASDTDLMIVEGL